MSAVDLQAFLRGTDFFAGMDDDHLASFAGMVEISDIPAGKHLMKSGEKADIFRVLLTGAIDLGLRQDDEGMIVVDRLEPGNVIGWSSLIEPHQWVYDAVTAEDTRLATVPAGRLRRQCEEQLGFGLEFMSCVTRVITRRLMATRMALLDTYC